MKSVIKNYKKIHSYTFENKDILKEKNNCICIYCGKKFEYKDIVNWVQDKHNQTAQYPFCNIDSVIPAVTINNKIITDNDIQKLNKIYFN